jgi:hypothetical protein
MEFIDFNAYESHSDVIPPCSFLKQNHNIIDSFPFFEGEITSIRQVGVVPCSINGEVVTSNTKTSFSVYFVKGRPTKSVKYKFVSGNVTPNDIIWSWHIKYQQETFKAHNGTLYVEVLPDSKVKFTWCSVLIKAKDVERTFTCRGNFVLD